MLRLQCIGITILFFFVSPVWAFTSCPKGQFVSWNGSSVLEFSSGSGNCQVLNPEIFAGKKMQIMGCTGSSYNEFTFALPKGLKHNCSKYKKPVITLRAQAFTGVDPKFNQPQALASIPLSRKLARLDSTSSSSPAPTTLSDESVVPIPGVRPSAAGSELVSRVNSFQEIRDPANTDVFGNLLRDTENFKAGMKVTAELDAYNHCLLSKHPERAKLYENKFAAYISKVSTSLNIPHTLLNCTCGRESMYDHKAMSPTGATGICQGTQTFVDDVNRMIGNSEALQQKWHNFLESIQTDLSSYCRKMTANMLNSKSHIPLSKDLLVSCPALGLGSAGIYLNHIRERVAKDKPELSESQQHESELDALAAVAGGYNIGVTYTASQLKDETDRSKWGKLIVANACNLKIQGVDPNQKLQEVRAHMMAIRNCMARDNYLNHQSEAMGGVCQNKTTDAAIQEADDFANSLPTDCKGQKSRPKITDPKDGVS